MFLAENFALSDAEDNCRNFTLDSEHLFCWYEQKKMNIRQKHKIHFSNGVIALVIFFIYRVLSCCYFSKNILFLLKYFLFVLCSKILF